MLSFKTCCLLLAIVLTGLSAGLFYAWSVSVIPGTRKVSDLVYLEAMQNINRAILNPGFFAIYVGSLALLVLSTVQQYGQGPVFGLLLAASLLYLVGTCGITAYGNIPLNNSLDALHLPTLDAEQLASFRQHYETPWNEWHTIRTASAVLAFLLALLAMAVIRQGA